MNKNKKISSFEMQIAFYLIIMVFAIAIQNINLSIAILSLIIIAIYVDFKKNYLKKKKCVDTVVEETTV